jgi:hypothetical protein
MRRINANPFESDVTAESKRQIKQELQPCDRDRSAYMPVETPSPRTII